jgi:hypothetical protein
MGEALLAKARQERSALSIEQRHQVLRKLLAELLGDIEPEEEIRLVTKRRDSADECEVEYLVLESEEGIYVPSMLLKPTAEASSPYAVVLALAEGGKSRFLRDRPSQLAWLLRQGFAVLIPDVRGTGETAYSQYNRGDEPALSLTEMGESLLGGRLKDVRSILKYLRSRTDVASDKTVLWGDSFASVNSEEIWVDELLGKPVSPQIQHVSSPLGAHLALLTALYEPQIRRMAVRGGLASYLSLLESNFLYCPPDIAVSRLLEVADLSDIAAALSPVALYIAAPVTGRNFLLTQSEVENELGWVSEAYGTSSELVLVAGTEEPETEVQQMVEWLAQGTRSAP